MTKCPNGCDLTGEPIPEGARHHYGDKTHFSRCIGIYDHNRDRTVEWLCPDCGVRWPRT
jgi:hypothetical protein